MLGNTYWVLGDVLRTVFFLAPGLALFLWSRRHPALTALVPDSRDPGARAVLRNALIFAAMFGTSGGALIMAAGIAILSWGPLRTGALLTSVSMAATLPVLHLLAPKPAPPVDGLPAG